MKRTVIPKRAAIYARYSSELQNPSSVEDQIALCRELLGDQFAHIPTDSVLVFSDAALTGSTMRRPGIMRMIQAVERGHADLIVAEGLDRMSRSLKDIATIYETVSYHGAMIWTAHEGLVNELHIGLKGTMNALVLSDLKARIKRGHRARIAAGFAASSCAYGYRVVRGVVDDRGNNVNGLREIDDSAADVIRRIFKEYADGRSVPTIVTGLNANNIPAPAGGLWKRNALLGSRQKQEGLLRNEIYLGKLVFNRTHVVRDPTTGRKIQILNPESEWTKVDVPHLRIIDDATWERVRLRDQRPARAEKPSRKKDEPRILKTHNQHALTGWVKCGWCGGPKSLANESRYLCSTHRYAKKCKNSRGVREQTLMDAVFHQLRDRIQDGPDFRPAFVTAFAREIKRRDDLNRKADDIKNRIDRLVDAIEHGVKEANVTGRILALQDELDEVQRQARIEVPVDIPAEAAIRDQLGQAVDVIEADADVTQTRLMFQCVLDQVVLTPIEDSHRGETVVITLKEDGWPDLWRMVSAEGQQAAPSRG